MNSSDDTTKAERIEAVYQEYIEKLGQLKKEQDRVVEEFVQALEQAKLDEIRSKMKHV